MAENQWVTGVTGRYFTLLTAGFSGPLCTFFIGVVVSFGMSFGFWGFISLMILYCREIDLVLQHHIGGGIGIGTIVFTGIWNLLLLPQPRTSHGLPIFRVVRCGIKSGHPFLLSSCWLLYTQVPTAKTRQTTLSITVTSVYPPPSNSGKWRFIGIPY